jgi:hypothetical protein
MYDAQGTLIDTVSELDYDIAVPAKSSTTFRIMKKASREPAKYAKHKVYIRWAERLGE